MTELADSAESIRTVTAAVRIATVRHDKILDQDDRRARARIRSRVPVDRRTRSGRRLLALTTDLLMRLGREPTDIERAYIDQSVALLLRAEAPDMLRKPEQRAGLIGQSLRILATLGITSFAPISDRDTGGAGRSHDDQVLDNLMSRQDR